MSTITKTLYLYESVRLGYQIAIFTKSLDTDFVLIGQAEAQFEMLDKASVVATKVASLDKLIATVRTESSDQIKRLQDQRSKLLCLENGVPA